MKGAKKRYAAIAAGVGGALIVCAIGFRFAGADANAAQNGYQELQLEHGDLQLTFMGEGATAEGSVQQDAEFDVTAVDFIVEESCVASGDTVKKGDALYRLSSDSIQKAAAYYEEEIAKAAKAADRAKTSYEAGVAEAEYTKTTAKAKAGSAKEAYDAANNKADEKVAEAQAAVDEAQAQIAVYQANLDQGVYQTDAGVSEKKKKSEEAEKAENQAEKEYQKIKSAYDEAALTLENQIAKLQQSAAESADGMISAELAFELGEANQAFAQKKETLAIAETALQEAQDTVKKAEEEYHTANTTYEKAVSEATARKEELENSLASLQRACTNAVNAASLEKVQNQNTYEAAILQGEYAEADYENTEVSLKAEYDTAQEELDRLKEEEAALLALEDGVVTAEYDGTLSQVSYEAGDLLQSGMMLAGYSDPDILTVAVEVSQEDIAKIAVGDTAEVSLPGMWMESIHGMISSIASEATAGGSISNVTYTVEIEIENENGTMSPGTSAYVTFSYGEIPDTDYILTEALYDIDGTSAMVKVYGENEEIEERQVTIGESTDRYTVVTGGLDTDTVCVIEGEAGTDNMRRNIQEDPGKRRHGNDRGEPPEMGESEMGEENSETVKPDTGEEPPEIGQSGMGEENPEIGQSGTGEENPDKGNTDARPQSESLEEDRIKTGGNENGKMER